MSLLIFKLLHYLGIFLLFFGFGGLTLGARMTQSRDFPFKRMYVLFHGIGLLVIILTGFAQLGLLRLSPIPNWAILKMVIWLFLGALLTLVVRKPEYNKTSWILIIALGTAAAALVVFKPF